MKKLESTPSACLQRVFCIPHTRPFFPVLVRALISGQLVPGFCGENVTDLASIKIFLPNRTAVHDMQKVLLNVMGEKKSTELPLILPIGEMDEVRAITVSKQPDNRIADLSKYLVVTKAILAWMASSSLDTCCSANTVDSVIEVMYLAKSFMELLDQLELEDIDLHQLISLCATEYHYQLGPTLPVLKIVAEQLSKLLTAKKSKFANSYCLIRQELFEIRDNPPDTPVIVAGSLSTVSTSLALMKAVLGLKRGVVVLPGLDSVMDTKIRKSAVNSEARAETHPQYNLDVILEYLNVNRTQIQNLAIENNPNMVARAHMVSEVMSPALRVGSWSNLQFKHNAVHGLCLIEAKNEIEEALSIACILRESVKQKKTAALITNNRRLVRLVTLEMHRFGLCLNDSIGIPLSATLPAVLARLLVKVTLGRHNVFDVANFLRHPMVRFGFSESAIVCVIKAIDLLVLRSECPLSDMSYLVLAFNNVVAKQQRCNDDWDVDETKIELTKKILARLTVVLEPLMALRGQSVVKFSEYLRAHYIALMEVVQPSINEDIVCAEYWSQLNSVMLDLTNLACDEMLDSVVDPETYIRILMSLLDRYTAYNALDCNKQSLLHVWDPLDARLRDVDRVILGSFIEGVWPKARALDAWIPKQMRSDIGLISHDRFIGFTAHDFSRGLLSAPEVFLTRSLKVNHVPTVASRWLQRLQLVLAPEQVTKLKQRGEKYLSLARAVAHVDIKMEDPIARPYPVPPLQLRPKTLSVMDINTWIKDPYVLYAKRILKLKKLRPIGRVPGKSEIDRIVCKTVNRYIGEITTDSSVYRRSCDHNARYHEIVNEELECVSAFPAVAILGKARLFSIGNWFLNKEAARYDHFESLAKQLSGSLSLPGVNFCITGHVDQIGVLSNDSFVIVNYGIKSLSSVRTRDLLSHPMMLLAMMVRFGAFGDEYIKRAASEIVYVQLARGDQKRICLNLSEDIESLLHEVYTGLLALVRTYSNPEQGYLSQAHLSWKDGLDGDYDHLARVGEWAMDIKVMG